MGKRAPRALGWMLSLWFLVPGGAVLAAATFVYCEIGGVIRSGGKGADALLEVQVSLGKPAREAVASAPPDAAGAVFAVCRAREGRRYGPFTSNAAEVEVRTNGDVLVTAHGLAQTVAAQETTTTVGAETTVTETDQRKAAVSEVAGTALDYLVRKHGGLMQLLTSRPRTLAEVLILAKMLQMDLNVPVATLFGQLTEVQIITKETSDTVLAQLQQTALFEGRTIFQDDRTVLKLYDDLARLPISIDVSVAGIVHLLQQRGIDVDTFLRQWLEQSLSALIAVASAEGRSTRQVLEEWGVPVSEAQGQQLDTLLSGASASVEAVRQVLDQVVANWSLQMEVAQQALTVEVRTSGPDLELRHAAGLTLAYPGLEIPYVLMCRNVGDLVAEDAVIVTLLPENTEVVKVAKSRDAESFLGKTPEGTAYIAWRLRKPLKPILQRGATVIRLDYSLRATPGKWHKQRLERRPGPA